MKASCGGTSYAVVLSSVLASCDGSGIVVGAKSIVSSAKTSTSTTGDKLPKVAISSDGGVFIFTWEMVRCQRCLDSGNLVLCFFVATKDGYTLNL